MDIMGNGSVQQVRSERECQYGRAALVNKVVSWGTSGLPFKAGFKHGVELMKGLFHSAVDFGPAAVFQ